MRHTADQFPLPIPQGKETPEAEHARLVAFHHARGWLNCSHKSLERLRAEYLAATAAPLVLEQQTAQAQPSPAPSLQPDLLQAPPQPPARDLAAWISRQPAASRRRLQASRHSPVTLITFGPGQ